jgi:hypothetical protein
MRLSLMQPILRVVSDRIEAGCNSEMMSNSQSHSLRDTHLFADEHKNIEARGKARSHEARLARMMGTAIQDVIT